MFEYIDINILYPHPNNPRKDLGDLTELAESIKSQGILQNLTVVKIKDSYYTVIIGHRRLAAAKLAGLTEVPCTIADMDMKTQLSTMLLENMQRTDLTPYEQAKGFQTCLDFGVTIDELSSKTGLSKTTVKHRLKILELDQNEVEKIGNTSIFDFIKLEEIEDVSLRNKALKYIGTSNFDVEITRLKDEGKKEEIVNCLLATLNAFAKKIEPSEREGWAYETSIVLTTRTSTDLPIPEDANCDLDNFNYAYMVDRYSITIYKKSTKTSEYDERLAKQREESEKRQHREERINHELSIINEVRMNFIKDKLSSMSISEHESLSTILMYMLLSRVYVSQYYSSYGYEVIKELTGFDFSQSEYREYNEDAILEHLRSLKGKEFHKFILAVVVSMYSKINRQSVMNFNGKAEVDDDVKDLYDLLEILGYQVSDVEKSILDGTHELFIKENNND